ncbi:carbamoyltransferase HypF [Bradyrhizobium sediminis]|uniref:Carbamoyltransferase HypF n=1 Tax=Bradyrhizobium sediminis TaxID=2840469 RepID=A0A975RYU3_9BRAD|nr:carbamoyltransferase HypF [Bradyrhizobium sediminis]QWG24794.1 carbamoyltransferase HypF [Bradyrhizobium sediminis]
MARVRPVSTTQAGASYRVRGLVQGVGFRPAVWRLATSFGLRGEVLNDGEGVLIRAWGPPDALDGFSRSLRQDVPRLARIDDIVRQPLPGGPEGNDFRIVGSNTGQVRTGVVPDAATCPDCVAEVFDPAGRRYRYPFTNCTHCGPRLSIIRAIPYDRATTSMAAFAMCPACLAEYENPDDRRFHAQPNACPDCGPRVWLADAKGNELPSAGDAIRTTAAAIRDGRIVAVKGIGGFHLACDATNEDAVARLRARKRRHAKPFALMARDIDMVSQYVRIADHDRAALASASAPIVILNAHDGVGRLAPSIAPGQSSLGFMLAYTPLHHLLMSDLCAPIVLTSGNRSDEPQVIANDEAIASLAGIADLWLLNDRDIVSRLDDSVVRSMSSAPRLLRRARGYAPEPIQLGDGFADAPPVMAMGAELKSTICLVREGRAIVSQHIGDLEDAATHADYRRVLMHYRELHCILPALVAVDAHPDYLSTQWGEACARQDGNLLVRIPHHHAHVASCLAEHRVALNAPPVLAIVLDGLGLGEDGTLWGGEIMLADYVSARRLASFMPVPLLGGARATREPWRNAFAHLSQFIGWDVVCSRYPDLAISRQLSAKPVATLQAMMDSGLNAPPASSAGRLFDAVAAVLGIAPETCSYEGQAAIGLEALAATEEREPGDEYVGQIADGQIELISWTAMWRNLLADLARGVETPRIAARFHAGLALTLSSLAARLAGVRGIDTIVLGGGVFQNRLLLEAVTSNLEAGGLRVLSPRLLPANDGGISLGQGAIAAARALCR